MAGRRLRGAAGRLRGEPDVLLGAQPAPRYVPLAPGGGRRHQLVRQPRAARTRCARSARCFSNSQRRIQGAAPRGGSRGGFRGLVRGWFQRLVLGRVQGQVQGVSLGAGLGVGPGGGAWGRSWRVSLGAGPGAKLQVRIHGTIQGRGPRLPQVQCDILFTKKLHWHQAMGGPLDPNFQCV